MTDQTVSFRQGVNGYGGTVDTQLVQAASTANHAASATLGVDLSTEIQVLLRFDDLFGAGGLQVPAGAEIVSATLTLFTTNTGNGASLHRMLTGWSDTSTWSSLGNGVQTDGVEAVATADVVTGTTTMGASSFNVTASLQAWAGGAANLGWVFVSQGTNGWDFYSAQGATPPQLQVVYRMTGPANTLPIANPDTLVVNEDASATISVLGNDTDADGHTLTVTGVGNAAHGVVVLNGDGTVTYTPYANFHGVDSFSYTISDGNGGTASGAVSVTVNPINDVPVAGTDTAVVNQDGSVAIAVLTNDSDIDGDTLFVTGASTPSHGAVVINQNGTITYTPAAGYFGTDSFTYTISDGHGGSANGTVNVTVNKHVPVNTAPVANPDTITINEDSQAIIAVLGNDTDVDGHALMVTAVGTPSHGTASVNQDGTITYTPTANYHGVDSFSYTISDGNGGTASATVSITVSPINDVPVANTDVTQVQTGHSVIVSVLANDTDVDGDSLQVTGVSTGPAHGTVVVNANNTITYTPGAGYTGPDSFIYAISDGKGGTATGTVNVTVTPAAMTQQTLAFRQGVNGYAGTIDTQLVQATPTADHATTATLGVDLSTEVQVLLRFNDLFGAGGLQIPVGAEIVSATLTLFTTNTGNGASLYRMLTGWSDSSTWSSLGNGVQTNGVEAVATPDVVTGTTSMGASSFNVTASLQAWAAGAANLGWVFVSQGTNGWDFYSAQGATPPQLQVVFRMPGPANTLPVANPDTLVVNEDVAGTIAVLSNDTDADGHSLSVTGVGSPAHGVAVLNSNGTITYTPHSHYHGPDSFTYTISDGHGGTANGTVTVTVNSVNDAPVAGTDTAVVNQNASVAIAVLTNDTDIDGDALTITGTSTPSHGAVVINQNGTITYTPTTGYFGTDSFTYTISDGHGGTANGTVNVTVNQVVQTNRPPVANPDTVTVDEDNQAIIAVLGNDSDPDGHALVVTGVGTPLHGTATVNQNGTITYTPAANYHGPDSFSYTVSDGNGGTASATVSITVNPINDAPIGNPDVAQVHAGQSVIVPVLLNDTDVDGDSLQVTGVATGPAHGTVVINANNTVTYTANAGYAGTDVFIYTLSDGKGGTATASVTVSVNEDALSASYIATSTNGVTRNMEHNNSSKSFFFDGSWWAVLPSGSTWAIHRYNGATPEPGQTGGWTIASPVLAASAMRADLAWDPVTETIYVLQHAPNQAVTRLFTLSFDEGTQKWGIDQDIAISGPSGKLPSAVWGNNLEMTLGLDQHGTPILTSIISSTQGAKGLYLGYPTSDDLGTWNSVLLNPATTSGAADSKADFVTFSHNGVDMVGIIYSRDGTGSDNDWSFTFRQTPTDATTYGTGWTTETIDNTVYIDNHISVVSDGEYIFAAIKDNNDAIWLLRGKPGAWETPYLVVDGIDNNPSRPALVFDETNDLIYIFYQQATHDPEGHIYMKIFDPDAPFFDPTSLGVQIMVGTNGAHDFLDPQVPTHAVGSATNDFFLLLAKNDQTNQVWYNDIQLGHDHLIA